MFKKKCPSCARKIEKKFLYCPYCGKSIKMQKEKEDFGMLGREDNVDNDLMSELRLPRGLDRIMGSLMKQIEKDLQKSFNEGSKDSGMPKGFKIQIKTGMPNMSIGNGGEIIQEEENKPKKIISEKISKEERERRSKLKKVDADSKMRRIGDRIVYEISTPGIKSEKDVSITKLEGGIEIRVYTKDKCYVKTIPLELEIVNYKVKENVLFVELKG